MARLKGPGVVAQSGGPTHVINESLIGVVIEASRNRGIITGLAGSRYGLEGIIKGDYVDLYRQSSTTLEEVATTPSAALGSSRKRFGKGINPEEFFQRLSSDGFVYFFYIGGNDSADNAEEVELTAKAKKYDLAVYHIPKTIDNDLRVSDHVPGYGTAAKFVAQGVMGDDLDNKAIPGVKIDVIMGRNGGFLAAAALARRNQDDGPHLIYLPEVPFSDEQFLKDVKEAWERYGRVVVAVSEGIKYADGTLVAEPKEVDEHGNKQLSGTGYLADKLAQIVKENTDVKRVRGDTFGYLQRSFPFERSAQDAKEARAVGIQAVKFAVSPNVPDSGTVIIRRGDGEKYSFYLEHAPLWQVAKKTKKVPRSFIAANAHDVTPAFIRYAKPLVGKLPVMHRLRDVAYKPGE